MQRVSNRHILANNQYNRISQNNIPFYSFQYMLRIDDQNTNLFIQFEKGVRQYNGTTNQLDRCLNDWMIRHAGHWLLSHCVAHSRLTVNRTSFESIRYICVNKQMLLKWQTIQLQCTWCDHIKCATSYSHQYETNRIIDMTD